jgi:hypothetical protein
MFAQIKTREQLQAEYLARKAEDVRSERNRLLSKTDYMVLPDSPHDTAEVRTYRQALRDIPEQSSFPDSVVWPERDFV